MNFDLVKITGEGLSVSVILGALFGLLPKLAALVSICWYGVLFYDRFKQKKSKKDET
jgi:hypothetical protein